MTNKTYESMYILIRRIYETSCALDEIIKMRDEIKIRGSITKVKSNIANEKFDTFEVALCDDTVNNVYDTIISSEIRRIEIAKSELNNLIDDIIYNHTYGGGAK